MTYKYDKCVFLTRPDPLTHGVIRKLINYK